MSAGRLLVLSPRELRETVEGALSVEFGEDISLPVPLCAAGTWDVTHWMANFSGVRENCREMLLSVADQGVPVIIIDADPNSTLEDVDAALSDWGLSIYTPFEHLSSMTREELEDVANEVPETQEVFGDDLSEVSSEDLIDFLRQVWTAA